MNTRKQQQMPAWLSRTLLIGLGLIYVLMPLHAFLSTWGGTAIGPLWVWKSWKEILLGGLVLLTLGWLCTKPALLKELVRRPLVIALLAYLVLSLSLAAVFASRIESEALLAGLAMNLRYLAAGVLAYIVFCYGGLSANWVLRMCWILLGFGGLLATIAVAQILLLPPDFLAMFGYDKTTTIAPNLMIDDNPDMLRAFATLRGPNDFGAFLVLPFILTIAWFRKLPVWVSVWSLLILTWGLILSGSRSAWIGLVVAIMTYVGFRLGKRLGWKRVSAIAVVVGIVGFGSLYAAVHVPELRMAVFHSSPGDSSLTEGSTDDHISATLGGAERVVEAPLGCGPGCAGPASYYGDEPKISENYFVQIAEETGIVGLGLFLALVTFVGLKLLRLKELQDVGRVLFAALIGYAVIGLLLHVWADDPLSITWWLLAGAVIGYNERQQWKNSKNSSRSKT